MRMLHQIMKSAQDPVCTNLRQVILEGWPGNIYECDPVLCPFFQFRDSLIVQRNLVFCRPCLFVSSTLRKELMSLAHSSHIGLGGVFANFASACSGPEWAPKWRILWVSVTFALHIMMFKFRNHYFNTKSRLILGTRFLRTSVSTQAELCWLLSTISVTS